MVSISADETMALDELFDVLSDSTRRRVLSRLSEEASVSEPEVPVAELSRDGDERDQERIRLQHTALPTLDAGGFIDWDRKRQVVRPGRRFPEVDPLIELLAGQEDELLADRP